MGACIEKDPRPLCLSRNRRRFGPTPLWLNLGLLAVEGFLWLSDRLVWFAFNHHRGWTAIVAVASAAVAMLVLGLWFAASLLFRWRFQFSIRSLLALVLIVAIPCSWLATEKREAQEQWKAADTFEDLDGTVNWDQPSAPLWLRSVLGDYYFRNVVKVAFFSAPVTDAGLANVEKLSQLEELDLGGTRVTDVGLEHLTSLSQLHVLALNATRVTDAGLERLKELRRLKWLWLDDTQITDAGLEHLEGLSQLRLLSLNRTRVTDAGLVHLKDLSQLQSVWLAGDKITDAGLEYLAALKQLRSLDLANTRVTAAGVKRLHRALTHCNINSGW